MSRENKKRCFIGLLLFLASFCLYLKTLCPTVWWDDSGELITVSHLLGIAHPPGYPLYTLLGKLFSLIPVGSIAWRVNLMSAFFASGTVVLIYFICLIVFRPLTPSVSDSPEHVSEDPTTGLLRHHIPAVAASLFFAFSYTFWSQAVIAEVYTLNAFFVALIILILVQRREPLTSAHHQSPITSYHSLNLLAFLYGLSLGNHHSMLLLLPAILYFILATRSSLPMVRSHRFWLAIAGCFLLGISVYLYLPIRSLRNPPLDWGNPEGLRAFVSAISREHYRLESAEIGHSVSMLLKNCKRYLYCLGREFTLFCFWLGLVGAVKLWKRERNFFIFSLLILLVDVMFFVIYSNLPDKDIPLILDVFFIPAHLIFSLWIGFGIKGLINFPRARAWCLVALFLPLIPLKAHYCYIDKSDHYFAYDYGMNILRSVEPKAILISKGDNNVFPLWYLQLAEGERKDVVVVVSNLLSTPWYADWYLKQLRQNQVDIALPFSEEALKSGTDRKFSQIMVDDILARNSGERAIYGIDPGFAGENYPVVRVGIVFKVSQAEEEAMERSRQLLWDIYKFRGLDMFKDESTKEMLGNYALTHYGLGLNYLGKGKDAEAAREYRRAVRLSPDFARAHNALGVIYAQGGQAEEAITEFRKAISSGGGDIKARGHYNLGTALASQGRLNEAIRQYEKALKIHPDFIEAHINLGVAYEKLGLREEAITEFKQVLELDPDNKVAKENLARVKEEIAPK